MPLYRRMADRVRSSRVIGTDDTVMLLLEPEKTRQARMWVYLGDASHPYTVFDFTPSRASDGPTKFLKDFRGTLVADAYGGDDGIVAGNGITRAGCWAHARRKFVDLEKSEPGIAHEAVTLMEALFAVERSIREAPRPRITHLSLRRDESSRQEGRPSMDGTSDRRLEPKNWPAPRREARRTLRPPIAYDVLLRR